MVAAERGWVQPEVDAGDAIEIVGGRHPVVEALGPFQPNDARLVARGDRDQLVILTGPNMAGKSTWMRQVALIVLLAQAGSFVPAASARIGLVDGIFTRIGAVDDLAGGRSTFMIEMEETASVLRGGDRPQPGRAGRDRARHQHPRRHGDRLVRRRVPGDRPGPPARRRGDPLPRAGGAGGGASRR